MDESPHAPNRPPHVDQPFSLPRYAAEEAARRVAAFRDVMATRRSCRFFSDEPVPRELIVACVDAANLAPSGANRQPWRFVIVDDAVLKHEIRRAAEEEERVSYEQRMPDEWLEALHPIGTDWRKPFLETAPYLVVVFRVDWEPRAGGTKLKSYYAPESCGIAAGLFLAACTYAGLATLTHTPSPMGFLSTILKRPTGEKPFLLIPVGYPAADAVVPRLVKRAAGDVMTFNVT
ncbi:MAG: hypothetical protein CHACPFDD_03558 [Phycisphaerae bacterium]|nr:hypothetical protein [Phycisphaerae bacterium]